VMLALSTLYANFADVGFVNAIFYGVKAAVLAIVVEAIVRIARRALTSNAMLMIAAAAFVALFFFAVPFPIVVLSAGLIGFFGVRFDPDGFRIGNHGKAGAEHAAPAAIDRLLDAGALTHTKVTPRQTLATAALWLAIWLAPVALLLGVAPDSVFTKIAIFFSQMSIVTFGGAYAVLAYVAQEAVATYHWLTAPEMLEGLALAETTPGPLILVLQHVGYLAAFRQSGMTPLIAGVLGAALTLWVTFVPSFLWIFAGAPYAERVRENKALSAALAAITAAVVGVILNLALWFALHVVFARVSEQQLGPLRLYTPELASLDPVALALSAAALLALLRFKVPMLALIGASALIGILVWLVRH